MKFILNLLLGIALPVFAVSNFSPSATVSKQDNTSKESRPYIVEIISAGGEKISELKGISNESDPFSISKAIGANPYQEDKFSAFPSLNMGIGGKITLYRAPDYKIKDGKKEYIVRSWTKTVEDLLSENKIELGQDDKINFSESTPLELNMNIVIIRVAKTTIIESKPIDYKTIKTEDSNLEKDITKVTQAGKVGKRNLYYEVTREDGVEKTRVLKKNEIASDPIDQKVTIGTKIISYGTGEASWYVSTNQMIGACNILPKGTKVRVVNLANGKSVEITTSGGGIGTDGRIVDLSTAAFQALGVTLGQGTIGNVRLEKVY